MAAQVLCRKSQLVLYLPSLRSIARHFRAFSSYDEKYPKGEYVPKVVRGPQADLPDPKLGLLGPQEHRFPLPGMVGMMSMPQPSVPQVTRQESDLFSAELPGERHDSVLRQFANAIYESDITADGTESPVAGALECVALECPTIMKRDFQDLFPGQDLANTNLTVITLSQQTENDMSGWNTKVEEEREELLAAFVEAVGEMCRVLNAAGFWADFVDPSSGSPYYGDHTNATLFETDDRYRHLGFEIDDLGCCKVIRHHKWGTHAYVGSLFTNAPCDHPILAEMAKTKSA